jgi:Ca-activated chloride channel family protein
VKDRKGQVVKSRLDEATLARIATDTGGVYLHAVGPGLGLAELYTKHIATLDKRELESTLERRYELRYQLPLGLAFLLLLLEPFVGERRATATSRRAWWRWRGAAAAVLLARVSVGWFDAHAIAREGNRLYDAGKYDDAAEHYNQALVDDPDSPRLHFNLGDARYKAGKFDDALAAFGQVPGSDADAGRSARLAYNVGNTKFRQGEAAETKEPQKALELWADALVAYRHALGANPDDVDAKFNHELVEKKIAALKKKLEQQKQQQQQQQQQKQDKQDGQKDQQQQSQQGQQDQQEKQEKQDQSGQQDQAKQQDQQQQGDQKTAQDQQGKDDQQQDRENGQQDAPQQGQQGGTQEQQQQQAAAGEKAPGGDAATGEARPGEMTAREAAALLDAQRTQEVQPGEIARRQQKARVAEPSEDW